MSGQPTQTGQAWREIVSDTLKRNSIQPVTDVPDVGATERDPVPIMDRFMRGLGTKG